ncbi:F-box domain containing protein [Plasmodium vivax]|uniref:F-box domain containing protein n=1 Tax=Plasmodium vivax (strain Salvador I) TaxID=126793 RepID=A5K8I8_PLAVS|nr:F-box domain containing protein [Plasmodium vivax]EDL44134.1 F-box domain containing protein [Plasmodium vivax]|eukprot:XP_001613861.1 F-box domain containing protein [Plasmodium vivax Sal-1]
MRNGNDAHLLVGISSDAFANITKFLTLNEALKLKLVCRHFRENIKDENAFCQNEWISLNNYIRFVRFVHPEKFASFVVSLLSDERNAYASPFCARRRPQCGISKKQLLLRDKPFLKRITLKGDFLRNANTYDISQLLRAHASTLEELHVHGLNDVNCPLFIYSHHGILFEFLSKEVLMSNLSVRCVKKGNLRHIQELLLRGGRLAAGQSAGEQSEEGSSVEESSAEESSAEESSSEEPPTEESSTKEPPAGEAASQGAPRGRDQKMHLLCEHIGVVYNWRKNCFERIKNYKPKLHLSNYISSLSTLRVLNLSGIQSYDMIEMLISVHLPSLKTINISCYDYFFYFYHMVVSICLYGRGKEVFSRYLKLNSVEINRGRSERKRSGWVERDKEMHQLIRETDEELMQVNKFSTDCQERYEQDAINYYALHVSSNDQKIFFTPTYRDRICMRGANRPVHYADGSYIAHDSDGEAFSGEPPARRASAPAEGKLKRLKRGGYIWLVENQKHKKNVSIEMLYLCKNIIEKEEKKGRKNIICLMNELSVEHFSLFNYGLSSPFLWLLVLIRCDKLKTVSILDLCLSHLLSALTFLEAYLKQHLFNFQGMMRRRRKRLGSIYFRFNDEEDIHFINKMYTRIINELTLSKFPPRKNRVIHIVIYVYNNKKENKQFVKYIRKISRSLWRCNYVVHYSIQYYKYKYFNRYFDIDNLYRDYVVNVLLAHHKLNQRLLAGKRCGER